METYLESIISVFNQTMVGLYVRKPPFRKKIAGVLCSTVVLVL